MVAKHVLTPTGQLFDLPIIGDDFAKIGRIIDLYAVPCSPDGIIAVYGFFQAIPTLFVTLAKPELIDINIKHRDGKPRKGKKYRFTAQDVFRDALIEVPVPRWVIFRVYEWAQRVGWYFLVADALEDFAINWMSLAYKYNGCEGDFPPYATFNNVNVLQPAAVGAWPMNWFVTGANKIHLAPPQVRIQYPGNYDVSWRVTTSPWTPNETSIPYNFALFVTDSQSTRAISQGETGTDPLTGHGQNSGHVRIFATEGNEIFDLRSLSTKDGYYFSTGILDVTFTDFAALSPDP